LSPGARTNVFGHSVDKTVSFVLVASTEEGILSFGPSLELSDVIGERVPFVCKSGTGLLSGVNRPEEILTVLKVALSKVSGFSSKDLSVFAAREPLVRDSSLVAIPKSRKGMAMNNAEERTLRFEARRMSDESD
jgi:hypothetical protein